jgi:apolipoprotein N-acyltransferase
MNLFRRRSLAATPPPQFTPDRHRVRSRRLLLCAFTGIMLGFSFPPFPYGLLACFALVPLLLVLGEVEDVRTSLKYGYAAMLVFHLIALNWTGGYAHMRDPYMMIAGALAMTIHPLFYFLPLSAYVWTKRKWGEGIALSALPLYWVGYEYAHSLTEWAFPWLTLGNSQSYNLFRIQFISVTGVWGLSLWIMLVNILAFQLVSGIVKNRFLWKSGRALALSAGLVMLVLLPTMYGAISLSGAPPVREGGLVPGQPTITVGMVQANIDPWEKWRRNPFETIQLYLERTQELAARSDATRPDVVFWPETAVTYYILTDAGRSMLDNIMGNLERMRMPVLTGFQHAVFYKDSSAAPWGSRRVRSTGERYDVYNAAAFLQPGERTVPWYGKMKMVPMAERVPYANALAFLDFLRWDIGIGGWQIGPGRVLFREHATGTTFCSVICYESTFPGFVASFVREGAEFLGIITIDSWWAKMSGAYQHHQFAILRAVENHRWVARCAAGGISSYIDPYGRVYDATELFTERNLSRTIGRSTDLTPYTRFGDWLGQGCLMGSGVLLAVTLLRRRGTNKGRGTREDH